jgi:hypothetical protein
MTAWLLSDDYKARVVQLAGQPSIAYVDVYRP